MDNRQTQNMAREKAVYRYFHALEGGDLDTVASILRDAEQDTVLAQMIDEVHLCVQQEGDVVAQVEDVAVLQRFLAAYQPETEDILPEASSQRPLPVEPVSHSSLTMHALVQRLKAVGFDHAFVWQRLLPKTLVEQVQATRDTSAQRSLVVQAASGIEHLFHWPSGTLLGAGPISVDMLAVGTTRFKKDIRVDVTDISAYTLYAHSLARLALQATIDIPRKPVPTEAGEVMAAIRSSHGTMSFEYVLRYVWSLGIPVLPLDDRGAFHGACWRFDGRNVIVLKQHTRSEARWMFDLLHELRHAGQDPQQAHFACVEADDIGKESLAIEERDANQFAGEVILEGRAEELTHLCVNRAKGSVERLKGVVPVIARQERVSAGALANYLAFRLSLQGISWWGAATNLQEPGTGMKELTREVFLQQANLQRLEEADRQLFCQALLPAEG